MRRRGLGVNWSEQPIFALGAPVELAQAFGGDVGLTLIPTPAFRTELGMRFQTLSREVDGREYSTALIPRVRMQYQFSKSLFLRGVLEYAAQERGTPADPVTGDPLQYCGDSSCSTLSDFRSNDIHVEGLLSYEPSPGTVFFLGYSRQMERDELAAVFLLRHEELLSSEIALILLLTGESFGQSPSSLDSFTRG